jgi:hypothetical protein
VHRVQAPETARVHVAHAERATVQDDVHPGALEAHDRRADRDAHPAAGHPQM